MSGYTTHKGYQLTPGQLARRDALLPHTHYGPDYLRGVATNLGRLINAEDHADVDLLLTAAEAALPGGEDIAEIIPTVEPK